MPTRFPRLRGRAVGLPLAVVAWLSVASAACNGGSSPSPGGPPDPRESVAGTQDVTAHGASVPGGAEDLVVPPIGPYPTSPGDPGAPSSAAEVYARVAPSMAYVETSISSGSAVLLPGDILVTNAHVVWPDERVRVVFPDGSELTDVPVAHQDLMGDLAVIDLGPAGGAPPSSRPAGLADGTDLPVGSEVYLVGYPGEAEALPVPAIARGIVSRHRDWRTMGLPFIQTDAAIGGGQSGGALVDAFGSVIGFSSMRFAEGAFGLAASAPHVAARVDRMVSGEDIDGLASRSQPSVGGARRQSVELASEWDEAVLVLAPAFGDDVEVRADSAGDAALYVTDAFGEVLASSDETRSGPESASWTAHDTGPVFVAVVLDAPGTVDVRSSVEAISYDDPDEAVELAVGHAVAAALDYPGDVDAFMVDLRGGHPVTVTVDTVNLVPEVAVEPWDADGAPADVSPSLGGPLGLTLSAAVMPGRTGRYVVTVSDADGYGTGGYLVRVD